MSENSENCKTEPTDLNNPSGVIGAGGKNTLCSITRESSTDSEDYVASDDLLASAYDDESTIAEAEAEGGEEDEEEIDNLKKESEMPIEELMKMYGVPPPSTTGSSSSNIQSSRLRKRNHGGNLVANNGSATDNVAVPPAVTKLPPVHSEQDTSSTIVAAALPNSPSNQELPLPTKDGLPDNELEEEELEDGDYSEDFSDAGSCDEESDEEDGMEDDGQGSINTSNYSAGSRLWCRALAPNSGLSSTLAYNSDEDEDYNPRLDASMVWKGIIRVGDQYQVFIPSQSSSYDSDSPPCSEGRLLWEADKLQEEDVISYIRRYSTAVNIPPPKSRTPDDEEALFWLMQSDYHVEESLRRLKNKSVAPSDIPTYLNTWSEHECDAFERGFAVHNKNFFRIRDSKLKSKTVGEIVQFYYVWKKTARHDEFMKMYRKDKKKYQVHPGITDYMDCLALEQAAIEGNYNCNQSIATPTIATTDNTSATLTTQSSPAVWKDATADDWARQGVRAAGGSWCPGRTSLGQAEVDRLIEEAHASGQTALSHESSGLHDIIQHIGENRTTSHSSVQNGISNGRA